MKKKLIAIIAILILGAGGFYYYSKNKKPEVSYTEYTVETGEVNYKILSTGTVKPKNRLEIKAPVAGRIEEVKVREGEVVRKGQTLAWMSSTERAAMLDAARSKGQEEYDKWADLYLPTPVLAPINGTIILKSVEPGQSFTNADAIFTMSDHLTVKANVDETDIALVKLNSKAEIVLDAYPNSPIMAHVDQLAFDATTTNNVTTYIIDVKPEKTPEFMRSGMTANVTFFVETKKDVVLVPTEAIKVTDGRSLVLKKAGNISQDAPVKTGLSEGKFVEITDGLKSGDIILIQDYSLGEKADDAANPFGPKFPNRGQKRR